MPTLTSTQEIEIIEGAVKVITDIKQALKDAVQALTPLADENLSLRDTIRALEAEDAASDEALSKLAALSPKDPAENPPVEDTSPPADPATGEANPDNQ